MCEAYFLFLYKECKFQFRFMYIAIFPTILIQIGLRKTCFTNETAPFFEVELNINKNAFQKLEGIFKI